MTLVDVDGAVRLHRVQAGVAQFYLVATVSSPCPAEVAAGAAYRMIAEQLAPNAAEIVHERIFANLASAASVLASREHLLASIGAPRVSPTFVEGAPLWGTGLAGVMIRAVQRAYTTQGVQILHDGLQPIGYSWSRQDVRHWLLQGVTAEACETQRGEDADSELQRLFERLARLLQVHGASFSDVTRTWFYIDRIVQSYAAFNRVRNHHYQLHGLTRAQGGHLQLPASTGIGARNLARRRVVVDVLATRPSLSQPVARLTSSTQQDPVHYGSSFARAAVVHEPDHDLVQLSGTAAIGAKGESLHPNNPRAQIDSTLEHVSALLRTRGAALKDIASATLFLKRAEHAALLRERVLVLGLAELPFVAVVADVCRDELLFEMDAELVVAAT